MPPESKLDKVLGSLLSAEMRALLSEMRVSLKEVDKLKRQMTQKLVSIKRARVVNGNLVLEFTDGISQNLGRIVAQDGKDGQYIDSAKVIAGQLVVTTNDGKVIRAGNVMGKPGRDGEDYVLTDDDIFEIALRAEDKLSQHVDKALEAENLTAIINNGKYSIDAKRIKGLVDQTQVEARFANVEQMIRTAVHRAAITVKNEDGDKIGTHHSLKFVGATVARVGDEIVVTVEAGETASHNTLTNLDADDHTQYTIISTGSGAPASTPARAGALYVDTTNDDVYVAVDTNDSGDWVQVNNTVTGTLLATNNLSDLGNAGTARTNLGLGTVATLDTGTGSGNVPVLDGSGKLSTSVLPSLAISEYGGDFADLATALADAGVQALQRGDWFTVQTGGGATYIVTTDSPTTGGDVTLLSTPTDAVSSVNGQTGVVVLDADDIDDTSTTNKFATAAQLAKVDSVETGADVTDTTNVTAAGALMDSELADIAFIKAQSDANAADVTAGTSTTKVVTPDALAGSDYGKRTLQIAVFESDTAVATGDGTVGLGISSELNGFEIVNVTAFVYDQGVTGTTDVQVRRRRGGANVDVLSTKVTVGAEYYAADGVINTSNDDLATGDMLFVDVDAVHSGTAPNGLTVVLTLQKP